LVVWLAGLDMGVPELLESLAGFYLHAAAAGKERPSRQLRYPLSTSSLTLIRGRNA